jgi:hypothetical protein
LGNFPLDFVYQMYYHAIFLEFVIIIVMAGITSGVSFFELITHDVVMVIYFQSNLTFSLYSTALKILNFKSEVNVVHGHLKNRKARFNHFQMAHFSFNLFSFSLMFSTMLKTMTHTHE